ARHGLLEQRQVISPASYPAHSPPKPVKGFLFAKLYFEAKEYELAKRHVSEYLRVQERDPKAHKFLGQLYEREGDISKAVGCYKRSVDLNPAQRDLVLKVAELLVSKDECDSRAEFWVEKAAKLLPGNPAVFNLKERLLSRQGQQGWSRLLKLLEAELATRPADAHMNVRLVQLLCQHGQLDEAIKHCLAAEKRGMLNHSLDWYTVVVHTLQEYLAQSSVSSNEKVCRHLQRELLLAHCSLLRITLSESSVHPSRDALKGFDHAMQTLSSVAGRHTDELCEVFVEMRGHLYLHAATLLLKLAQDRQQTWRAIIDFAALCYLLAYQVPRPKPKMTKREQSAPQLLELLANDRQSQAGHMLLNLSTDPVTLIREVVEAFGNRSGQDSLFELLFGSQASTGSSFIANDDIHSINTMAPELSQLAKCDTGSILLHGGNLQHLSWLGLQWTLLAQRPALRDWLPQLFPRLTLETSRLDTNAPESICLLDLEVRFLKGGVNLQQQQQLYEPRCLPLPLLRLLTTDRQREWWDAIYSLIHKRAAPGMSAKLRMIVQHGLNTLRAIEKHGLQPALAIHWAQCLIQTGDGVNSYYDQKEYIARSVHYWKVVLPMLERIKNRRSIPEPLDPLFIHFPSRDIQVSSVKGYEEEAKIAYAALLDIEGKTEEAIATLETINNMSSVWHLAQVNHWLKQLCNHCLHFISQLPVSMEEVVDLLNDVNQQLEDIGEAMDEEEEKVKEENGRRGPAHSSPAQPTETNISPKTPPHWVEDQKSLLQMLCQQVEALKNEVHDLRHNSSGNTGSPHKMYGESYGAEGLQEAFTPVQSYHGAPLTVATTGPSVYYNQSPAYNSQYLLRTAANVTPTKGPMYGINRMPPQQHMYTYQQPTHTPPLQTTPACIYPPQDQVFGGPLRFESPATSLLSPYSEEYYGQGVTQQTTNPPLPEPGYFTKPSVVPVQPPKSIEGKAVDFAKLSFSQQAPAEIPKVPSFGAGAVAQSTPSAAFKFNSNFKSNDGDFTFSPSQAKHSESLLGLLTSDIPSKTDMVPEKPPAQEQPPNQTGIFTFGAKSTTGFSFVDSAQSTGTGNLFGKVEQPFKFGDVTKPLFGLGKPAAEDEKAAESDNDSTHVEEDEDGPHFEPIVPLPDKVDVKTGEEEEEEMFCNRAKLYRFDTETKEWKERGIGNVKILKHSTKGKVRLLMRREQVLKICANHYITADMLLKPNAGSDKSWVWNAIDYADEEPKPEQLAIRFKTVDEASLFKARFEEAQKIVLKSTEKHSQQKKKEESQKDSDSLAAQFALKEGEWECTVCCVRNKPTDMQCVACQSACPNSSSKSDIQTSAESNTSKSTDTVTNTFGSGFGTQFGQKPGQWDCDVCSTTNEASADICVSCKALKASTKTAAVVQATPVVSNLPAVTGSGTDFAKNDAQWDCNACLVRNDASASECVSCHAPCETPSLEAMFAKKDGEWDCDTCLVRNDASANKCAACQTPNPNAKSTTSTAPSASTFTFSFGTKSSTSQPTATGFTVPFGTGGTFQFGQNKDKSSVTSFKFEAPQSTSSTTTTTSGFSFSMPIPAGGFKFGIQDTAKETHSTVKQASPSCSASSLLKSIADKHSDKENVSTPSVGETQQDQNPLIAGKPNTFSFADLAKSTGGDFQFGQKDPNFKGFSGAGEQVFSSFQATPTKTDVSNEQDEDDMYKTEENDDIQFEPVVQIPEKVDLVTGEEDEQVLYSQRVKLFRFDSNTSQWKERGVGTLKFLKNNTNGKLRVLMRREQVLKVCANHWITTTMNLKPLAGSDKAWIWMANDVSDGDAKLEQLAAKFKSPELAEEFKEKFEECQRLLLDIPLQTPHKLVDTGRTAHLIQKAEEMKSGLKDLKFFLTDEKTKIQDDDHQADITTSSNVSGLVIKAHGETTGPTLEWDNYDLQEDALDDSSVYASPIASSPLRKNLFRFGESTGGFNFSFQPGISPSKSPKSPKLNQSRASVGTDDEQDVTQDEERDGQYFEPVVPLPDLVEISTGEENEQVVFSHRAKLYRYDKELGQWKERGIGDLKILQNYETKRVRLIMRRDQVLKICANHWINAAMKLEPMKGAEKAWVWSAMDFAEAGEGNIEQLAVRFKLQDTANTFKQVFEEAKIAQQKEELMTPVTSRVASSQDSGPAESTKTATTVCGKAAIAVLDETTKECTKLSPDSKSGASSSQSPVNPSKTVVSPPKFVFGADSLQKFFGTSAPKSHPEAEVSGSDCKAKEEKQHMHKDMLSTNTFAHKRNKADSFLLFSKQLIPSMTMYCSTSIISVTEPPQAEGGDAGLNEDSEVEVVYVREPTAEQAALARRLLLPLTFFCYQSDPGYVSDDQTDDEDFESAVKALKGKLYRDRPGRKAAACGDEPDCQVVWEKKPTPEQEEKAKSLQLPPTFFCGLSTTDSDLDQDKPEDFETEVRKAHTEAAVSSSAIASHDIIVLMLLCPVITIPPTADSTSFGFNSLGGFSFADLAKNNEGFAFGKKDTNFSWANAGAAVFGSTVPSSPKNNGEEEGSDEEEASNNVDIHFEPIVSLPEVETKSGEEDEEILFKERTRLYRWDRDASQWKERGIGDIKILFHPSKHFYRILMRRDQVLRVCANHTISQAMELKPMNASANALIWTATDYSGKHTV
uniref:RAN binding protein 2 n=1 Tax=Mastacembelus armatus TaxID=205130 RepID=A0A7N8Y208_9TELE